MIIFWGNNDIYIYIYTHTHTHTHSIYTVYIYIYIYIYIYKKKLLPNTPERDMYKCFQLFPTLIIIRIIINNLAPTITDNNWAPKLHIMMVSEGSCDTEDTGIYIKIMKTVILILRTTLSEAALSLNSSAVKPDSWTTTQESGDLWSWLVVNFQWTPETNYHPGR